MKVINKNGTAIDFETAASLMDNDLRESVYESLFPSTEQEFLLPTRTSMKRCMESGSSARQILAINGGETMAEYIEREAAIKVIYESDHFSARECFGWRAREIEEALRAVPATPVPQWISVMDRLPYYDNPVLIASSTSPKFVGLAWFHAAGKRWELLTGHRVDGAIITHWMPLPQAPMEEKK